MQRTGRSKYEKFLDKENLLDKSILESAKSGELSVGVVWIDKENRDLGDKYSARSLPHRGRRTS